MCWCLHAQEKAKAGHLSGARAASAAQSAQPLKLQKSGLLSAQMADHDNEEGAREISHG